MILITGATGFVGSHLLLHLLENNWQVRALYRTDSSRLKTKSLFKLYGKESLFENIDWFRADITDIPSLEPAFTNIEKVYHCAAFISFDPSHEELLRKINIEGTANIVNCCLAFGVRKICHVSSIAALGDPKPHELVINEETEWNPEKPHSDYAISKYGAEMEIWRAQQEGLEVVIVNPGVILGPGFWQTGSGEIFTRVANKLTFYTKGITGFASVLDLVHLMAQLMESQTNGERFAIVSGNYSFEEILTMIARALGVKPPAIYAESWMTSIAWRVDGLLSLFGKKRQFSHSMALALHAKHKFSNEKTRAMANFSFEPIPDYIKTLAGYYLKK